MRRLVFTLIVGALAVIFDTTIMSVAINGLAGQLHAPGHRPVGHHRLPALA